MTSCDHLRQLDFSSVSGEFFFAPGAFASKLNRVARDTPEAIINLIPSKRIGAWEDMAGAAIFLASRAGDYVVGETVVVDGGLVHAGRME